MILINLTCGRNPWKRACLEDSTFRAYVKDPFFLKSILPLTDDMIRILCRIFECDPVKRISIPELRKLVQQCPRLTTTSVTPWITPPPSFVQNPLVVSNPVVPASRQPSDSSSDASMNSSTFSAVSEASSSTEDFSYMDNLSPAPSAGAAPGVSDKADRYVLPLMGFNCSGPSVLPNQYFRPLVPVS